MTFNLDDSWISKTKQSSMRQLRRLPVVEELFRVNRLIARGKHADGLPSLDPPMAGLFGKIVRDGIERLPIEELGVPFEATLAAAHKHVETLRRGGGEPIDKHSTHIATRDLVSTPEPYVFGLSPRVLDFVERYIGMPVDYLGVDIKREKVNSAEDGVRLWHFDVEDARMVRFIVYLDDVDESCGPFECIQAAGSDEFRKVTRYVWGDRYSSSTVESLVTPASRYKGVGSMHSVHVFDGVRLLHRAGLPTARDRYSMTFSFASKEAYFAFQSARETQAAFVNRWGSMLDARQRQAVAPPPGAATPRWADALQVTTRVFLRRDLRTPEGQRGGSRAAANDS